MIGKLGIAACIGFMLAGISIGSARPTAPVVLPSSNPAAEAIYARARAAWGAMRYPSDIAFSLAIEATVNGAAASDHYTGEVLPATNDCLVDAFSAEEAAHPNVPHGINIGLPFIPSKPMPPTELLGVPRVGPTYSFGMRGPNRMQPAPEATESDGTRIIGRIAAESRRYAITLVGNETIAGAETTHLHLEPLRDPTRFRLRDLWIDTASSVLVRLRIAGNFIEAPSTDVAWTVDFMQVGGATYIASETAEAPIEHASRTLNSLTIRFSNIHPQTGFRPHHFDLGPEHDSAVGIEEPHESNDPNLGC